MTTKMINQIDMIEQIEAELTLSFGEFVNEIRVGGKCSKCSQGFLEYDGMLNLVCSNCGNTTGGCFT